MATPAAGFCRLRLRPVEPRRPLLRRVVLLALLAAATLGAAAPATSPAAPPAPRRISLAEALRLALAHNRTLRAAELERRAAAADITVARSALLPRLDTVENYSYTNNPVYVFSDLLLQQQFNAADFALNRLNFPSALSNFQSQVVFSQTLFDGGRGLAALRAARYGARAKSWQATRVRQQTEFAVIQAYYAAVLAERQTGVLERALAAARAHRAQARQRLAQGLVVRSDVLRTEVMVGTFMQERTMAQSELRVAWAQLAHVLGQEDQRLAPQQNLAPAPLAVRGRESLETLVAQAARQRPEVSIAEAQVNQAQAALTLARAEYLPTMNVAAAYENDSQELSRAGYNYWVFVYGRFNLFNGFASGARVDKARAELKRARTLREELLRGIGVQVEKAYRTLDAAEENLGVARRNRRYAADTLRILEDRYGAGLATNVSVLDAQTVREQAGLRLARAEVETLVDAAALNLAVGRAPAGSLEP